MSPPRHRRRLPPPAAELPDHIKAALNGADAALGELNVSDPPVATELHDLGFAFQLADAAPAYLSLEGWATRDELRTPASDGGHPALHAGPFTAADGHGTLEDRAAHCAAAQRAWPYSLELRRLEGDMATPAPLERHRPVPSVCLALEAASVPPAETKPAANSTERCLHTGYQVAAFGTGVRLDWRRAPADSAGLAVDAGLAQAAKVLDARGWNTGRYLGSGRRPYLVVWPKGTSEPLAAP